VDASGKKAMKYLQIISSGIDQKRGWLRLLSLEKDLISKKMEKNYVSLLRATQAVSSIAFRGEIIS
jgi:hypothetical protein